MLDDAKRKEVFCVANTDLLAIIQSKWRKHVESGGNNPRSDATEGAINEVDDLANQVALVATEAHIEQAKAIFDPVFTDIERSYSLVQNQQRKHDRAREAIRTRREQQVRTKLAASSALSTDTTDTRLASANPTNTKDGMGLSREQRKRQLVQAARIPWPLLDKLASERRRFEDEKAMFKVWRKSSVGSKQ